MGTEECLRLSPSLESSNSTGEQKIFHETRAMNSCQIGLFISYSILLCSDKCGGHLFQGSNPRVAVFLKMVGFGSEGYQDFCVHSAICMHFPSKRGQPFVRAIHPPSTRHDCPTRRQTRRDETRVARIFHRISQTIVKSGRSTLLWIWKERGSNVLYTDGGAQHI